MEYPFQRRVVQDVLNSLKSHKNLLQIISGPRQVGKTVAARQIAMQWPGETIFVSADSPLRPEPEWLRAQWGRALRAAEKDQTNEILLVVDEVQKVRGWSEEIKFLWDRNQIDKPGIKVLLLGSSTLLLQQGLTESLAGRFFLHRCSHWEFSEMAAAFSFNLDQWLYFGGYPGAAEFIEDEMRWAAYVTDSLVETVLTKDVLQMQTVTKPALLRHLFFLSCGSPAQILSYNKMLGQLHDAGNTTTLAHYVKLLESAFLLSGLEMFKRGRLKKRGSSPKLVIWNNALLNAVCGGDMAQNRDDFSWWGRLVENAVGAYLLNSFAGQPVNIYYWRERGLEVDFVVETPRRLWALEVKSGNVGKTPGLTKFCRMYPEAEPLIIGSGGVELEEFFAGNLNDLFLSRI